ncbi:MAG TPA: heparan-alpha-glucosaminide N-acetyltransferase domain-containing protein [Thermoanaerobaculia bacterium]
MTTVDEVSEVAAGPITSTVAPLPPARERLVALDVFRGMTIAGMLLVNDPGSWSAIYPPLEHAEWHGWTPTDLIFPFFLFIVGVTTHLSLGRRKAEGADRRELVRKIVRRGMMIVLVGLLLNAFPFFWWGRIPNVPDPTFAQRVAWRVAHLRFAGVLQRIGIAYICAALLTVYLTRKQIVATIVAILVGYWVVMTLLPVPGTGTIGYFTLDQPSNTLAAWSDRKILGLNHIWAGSKTFDPEGPLSTFPAIATALLGVFAGEWIADKRRPLTERVVNLFGFGALGLVGGRLWGALFPINKNLWTSSYVIFTAGFACVVLATCLWLIDLRAVRGWTLPFVIYGVNPLVAFAGSGLMARTTDSLIKVNVGGKLTSLHQASYELFYEPFFEPRFASLLWAISFVLLWLGILAVLHRRGWIVKV